MRREDVYDLPTAKKYNLTRENFAFDFARDKNGEIIETWNGLEQDYSETWIYDYYEE